MKRLILALTLLVSFLSCHTVKNGFYQTNSYVWVGKKLPHTQPPYIIDLKKGRKHLIFIGCDHNRDTTHPQFESIERYFIQLKPQVAFNEGGTIARRFINRNEAILEYGESGCLKYLSDKAGISLINGDLSDSLEFTLMLKKYPKDQLFLYYIMERTVIPHLSGFNGKTPFAEVYGNEIRDYYLRQGFPLSPKERSLVYFEALYKKYIGTPFQLSINADIEKFDYVNGGNCRFCALGRASKMTRDSVLLAKIDHALTQYDRIMVTFGAGHALALKPALKQLVNKKR